MVYKESTWDLKDLVSNKKEIDTLLKKVEIQLKKIESYKAKFTSKISTTEFNKLIDELEKYDLMMSSIDQYSGLLFSEDTSNKEAIVLKNKLSQLGSEHSNRLLWFKLNFIKFSKADTDRLIKANDKADYSLRLMLLNKDHVLSDAEERIINIKDTNGIEKLDSIYTILSSSFMYEFEGKKITREEIVKYVRDADPVRRKKAYDALFEKYKEHENLFGEIYTAILSDMYQEDIKLRKYHSPISIRNKSNDIEDKTVEVLMKVARKNQHLFHSYFKLKAKELKMKKLRRYDLYAPITEKKEKIPFEECSEMVLDTFKEFSAEFYILAKSMFDRKHIHSIVQKGKRDGAFMSGVRPDIKPYVLLSYTKDWRNVSTLAHELGHAIHFMLSSKRNSIFHIHAALPIAETASIFSELLLIEKMKKEKPHLRKQLLFSQLDDAYATISRQLEFIAFEVKAHDLIQKESLSSDELNKVYLEMLKEHFGDSVDVPNCFESEWSYIPHIFQSPFYCYAYGFGNLLSFAVYAKYKQHGKEFGKKLIKMLEDGGSKSPKELVRELGFDINSEEFWQSGFNVVKDMIKELESLS